MFKQYVYKLRMHSMCIYWYLKNYHKSSKCLFHCLMISYFIGWLLEFFYSMYNICIYKMMRKCYERRMDASVSLCLLNINSLSVSCCLRTLCMSLPSCANWNNTSEPSAEFSGKERDKWAVAVKRNRFFTVKALIKSKKLARCKGTNDCSQIPQQEIFQRDLWLQGFVLNVRIILALWLI